MADRDLPPREERGNVQPAGRRQHGRCLLHARCRHGSVAHHLHLRTLVLLAAALLLHGRLLRPARLRLQHQQGETGIKVCAETRYPKSCQRELTNVYICILTEKIALLTVADTPKES